MGWVRIDDNAPHHSKQLKAGPAACWLWVCGLAYCQRMLTDGFVPIEALHTLGVKDWKKLTEPLITTGLWEVVTGGYHVHDYLDYNFSSDEAEERHSKHHDVRSAAGRIGGQRSGETRRSKTPKQTEASSFEANEVNITKQTKPHPIPSHPIPSHPTTPSSPLVVGPLEFDKLIRKFAYVGARLRVPHVLHDECRTKLGGSNSHQRLMDWYSELDAGAEQTGEPVPDIFVWMRPKFVIWAQQQAGEAELERFRPKGV